MVSIDYLDEEIRKAKMKDDLDPLEIGYYQDLKYYAEKYGTESDKRPYQRDRRYFLNQATYIPPEFDKYGLGWDLTDRDLPWREEAEEYFSGNNETKKAYHKKYINQYERNLIRFDKKPSSGVPNFYIDHLKYYILLVEHDKIKAERGASKIQRAFRKYRYDPQYKFCHRVQLRSGGYSEDEIEEHLKSS